MKAIMKRGRCPTARRIGNDRRPPITADLGPQLMRRKNAMNVGNWGVSGCEEVGQDPRIT